MVKEIVYSNYSNLFEVNLLDEIISVGKFHQFKADEIIIDVNQKLEFIPLLLNGAIRIMRDDQKEGELLLYFLEKGDTCAMTMTCCLGEKLSNIRAIAETDGEMILVPISMMDQWLAKYSSWRNFVFESYNNRLEEMLVSIDNLAFNDMEQRLKKYLLDVATINQGNLVPKTHQEIAYALNTSRVVISRILKKLENQNFIKLNRNSIEIID